MLNFDTDLDVARAKGGRTVTVTANVPAVRETLTVTRTNPAPPSTQDSREARVTDIGKAPEDWTWEDLRNYVVRQIETFFGEFPKEPAKLRGIFLGFHQRHGAMAGPIAVAAFETFQGRWKGAPISVTRFCKGSDPWFAEVIKDRLNATT